MNLKPLASNMTEIETNDYKVLFSYKTPVAYFSKDQSQYYQIDYKWSATTSRHINKWLNGNEAAKVPQNELDVLLNEVK